MESSRDSITTLLLFIIKVNGFYEVTKYKNLLVTHWMLVFSELAFGFTIAGNIVLIYLSESFVTSIRYILVIIGVLHIMFNQITSMLKVRELKLLISNLQEKDDNWCKIRSVRKIKFKISHDLMSLYHTAIVLYSVVAFSLLAASPMFTTISTTSLIYTSWYPWDVRNVYWYIITYLLQAYTAGIMQLVVYATLSLNILIVCLFLNDFGEIIDVLGKVEIVNVNANQVLFSKQHSEEQIPYSMEELLRHCISRHQYLMRYVYFV